MKVMFHLNMLLSRNLSDQLTSVIGRRIVDGEYGTGELLPNEAELLGEFGVSRTVLREAIRALAAKGLVETKQKVGTRATSPENWALLDPEILEWQVQATNGDQRGLLRSLVEVRAIVEPAAARLAARRGTPEEIAQMREALADMAAAIEAQDDEAFIAADLRFHTGILVGCHNPLLLQMNATIASALRMSRDITIQVTHSSETAMPLHAAVLDFIASGQPEPAADACERLIGRTRDDITSVVPGVDFDAE